MTCLLRTVVFFIVFVNICIGRRWNEFPLSRYLHHKRNEMRNTKLEADSNATRPNECVIAAVWDLDSTYKVEYAKLNSSAHPRVISTSGVCDKVMIFVKEQQRSRLELNGHDITDKLHFDRFDNDLISCYNAIFNSNEYALRRGDATCSVSLRVVTGFPIVNVAYLIRR